MDEKTEFLGWLCVCGHYEETEFHCSCCGAEPPWGCDCDGCNTPDPSETDIVTWNALCDEDMEIL